MNRKLFTSAIVTVGAAAMLFVGGCSTNADRSEASTGESSVATNEYNERARWTDDKGRYRLDWRYGKNAPYGYPKPLPK